MASNDRNRPMLWHAFLFEIDKTTVSLMFLLQSLELLRSSGTLPRVSFPTPGVTAYTGDMPRLPLFGISPNFRGMDFNQLLECEGEAEQLAFKGWVEQIYNIAWESNYRNVVRDSFEGDGIIRPRIDAVGDLRLIRNDLIHTGIASEENCGRCETLKWFDVGDSMVLGMRHVFDFLNQMGLMTTSLIIGENDAVFSWDLNSPDDNRRTRVITPKLVSIRTVVDRDRDTGQPLYMMSLVFEDGLFIQTTPEISDITRPDASEQECRDIFTSATIDENGDLKFSTLTCTSARLYRWALDAERIRGPSMPGPAMQFREVEDS